MVFFRLEKESRLLLLLWLLMIWTRCVPTHRPKKDPNGERQKTGKHILKSSKEKKELATYPLIFYFYFLISCKNILLFFHGCVLLDVSSAIRRVHVLKKKKERKKSLFDITDRPRSLDSFRLLTHSVCVLKYTFQE